MRTPPSRCCVRRRSPMRPARPRLPRLPALPLEAPARLGVLRSFPTRWRRWSRPRSPTRRCWCNRVAPYSTRSGRCGSGAGSARSVVAPSRFSPRLWQAPRFRVMVATALPLAAPSRRPLRLLVGPPLLAGLLQRRRWRARPAVPMASPALLCRSSVGRLRHRPRVEAKSCPRPRWGCLRAPRCYTRCTRGKARRSAASATSRNGLPMRGAFPSLARLSGRKGERLLAVTLLASQRQCRLRSAPPKVVPTNPPLRCRTCRWPRWRRRR